VCRKEVFSLDICQITFYISEPSTVFIICECSKNLSLVKSSLEGLFFFNIRKSVLWVFSFFVFKPTLPFQAIIFQNRNLYIYYEALNLGCFSQTWSIEVVHAVPVFWVMRSLLKLFWPPACAWQRYQVNTKELRSKEVVVSSFLLLTHGHILNC
jgi:hypothetical protein